MRIAGITIPDEKRLEIALTSVYGIGSSRSKHILNKLNINPSTRAKNLKTDEENQIRKEVESFKIEGDLRRETTSNIKRLKQISSYRGARHSIGLPVRGQNTKTNSRTRKGAKKTMGSGKVKVQKK